MITFGYQQTVSAGAGATSGPSWPSWPSGPSGESVARGDSGGGPSGSGERRRSAWRLRNSRNSSFMARTRASTSSRPTRARGLSGVDGVGVRVARSHS